MERKLPSRLVDVGVEDSQARLCLAGNIPVDARYLTLSHCWGNKAFSTLTRRNLETFSSGIPDVALSKTFKDAMKSTRELGFKYLWVDSLCIIQDNQTDWEQQARLMGNIYANSSLNLAAVDSPDGDGGCFFRRDSRHVQCWKLRLYDDREAQKSGMWNCRRRNFGLRSLSENVLSTRAWAFQERCLAPRGLFFGKSAVGWECREMAASEILPNGFNDDSLTMPEILPSQWRNLGTQQVPEFWFSVTTSYSKGDLTIESDKLVAISGIARLFAAWFKVNYLAGLWRENLVAQLIWYAPSKVGPPTKEYRAPSWSWASTNSQVHLPLTRGSHTSLVAVDQVHVTSLGSNFDGATGGELTLKYRDIRKGEAFAVDDGQFCVKLSDGAVFYKSQARAYPDHNLMGYAGSSCISPFY